MTSSRKKFIIIDGNALLHRAWHALPPMTTQNGLLVNAVYGFTSILLKIIKELKPDYLCAAFDRRGKTLRAEEFTDYKAQRKKQPDELYEQIPWIEKILAAFNVPVIDSQKAGYEADDVIGTVVTELSKKHPEIHSVIVTGDLDTLQLVNDSTEVFTLKKGISDTITYDAGAVQERYGLKPKQLIDFKALRGDPSDNVPGVKGIGEKTAAELIKQFGSLEKLYQNLNQAKVSDRIKNLLAEHKQEAFLSRKIVTIQTDLPTNFKLADTKMEGLDEKKTLELFRQLEFKSLINKIPKEIDSHSQTKMEFLEFKEKKNEKFDYQLINNEAEFKKFLSELKRQKEFALDTETTSLNVWRAELLGLSFAWQKDRAFYLASPNQSWLKQLKPILEDSKIKK
ncbi:MAG TPA: 5'-3' exonuclease H3TH domain-containing protein, partial [Patescibacteria group bacterium]|nr:5'-3' exonuclease H3TH domain-containing protein [Patescibacteria group bacterium]